MPTYEYACKDCGEHLEIVQSFRDEALTECPRCEGSLRKVFSAAGIIFKGSGWHVKDYASSGNRSPAASGSSGEGGSSDGGAGDAGSRDGASSDARSSDGASGDATSKADSSSGSDSSGASATGTKTGKKAGGPSSRKNTKPAVAASSSGPAEKKSA